MTFKLFTAAIALLILSSCTKSADSPYSIFNDTHYKTLKEEIIDVNLNDYFSLVIDNGFESSTPVYTLQKNNEGEQIISGSSMVSRESHGWNGKKGLKFEIVRVQLNFNSNEYNSGDHLKISARHGSTSNYLTFRII